MAKKWNYIGIFLNEESSRNLLEAAKEYIPEDWTEYAHHLTLAFNSNGDPNDSIFINNQPNYGKDYSLTVKEIGVSDKAIAVRVSNVKLSDGRTPHITVAVSPDGKPVDSNGITDWKPLGTTLTLHGKCGYFGKGQIHYN